jgi:polypyrimidine tract-binding protein 2
VFFPFDQSQGRGDEVFFFVHISTENCMLYLVICLRKQTDWFCTFCFLCDYIPRISVLLCSVVLRLKLIFYESIVILFSLSYTSLFILLSFYHILLYLFSFLSISSLSQCCPAVWNPLDAQPNRILLVTIHHVLYPITVDVLFQVFSPHGSVEKIVTFQKSAGFQALIQYQSQQSAITARTALQGRNIYDGCCQLDIQFSNLDELQVNYNNDRSRDYTNPNLPTEQKGRPPQLGYGDAGNMYGVQGSGPRAVGYPQMPNAAAIAAAFGGGLPPGITGTNERSTLLVSNLNPDRIDEDKLFNLFSLYGNIVRIKLLRNKPDHALIQMGDGFQAELAVHFLKGAMLFDKRLEVNFSKHPNITQGADTHDYSNSNLNRFNRNAAKNYRYCCSPTKMIHLSTLPQDITEEEIVTLLEEHGTIVNSKVFEMNGKKQGLVQFETEDQATEALVCKHATSLSGSVIRISYSQLQNI